MVDNTSNKTILILTAQFGAGHVSAANAVKDYILEKNPHCNIVIENFITASIPTMNQPLVKWYEINTKYIPGLYNYYYYLKKSFDSKKDIASKIYTPKLAKYIVDVNPDIIISTFPLACACIDQLKSKYPDINIPSITVVTDVVDSLEWIYNSSNMYFVPSCEIKNRYIQKGINPDIIKVTGVPVRKDFCNDKVLNNNKYKILLVGGGRGLFDMDTSFFYYLDNLLNTHLNNLEITIVCGKNKKLYDNLAKKHPLKNIKVLGFVNNMPDLLKENNLIVTKPGGATLFEAIHAQVPVIVKLPKIGQEIENARFIIDKGIGIVYNDDNDLKEIFNSLLNKSINNRVHFMIDNIINLKKTIHLDKIADYILEL